MPPEVGAKEGLSPKEQGAAAPPTATIAAGVSRVIRGATRAPETPITLPMPSDNQMQASGRMRNPRVETTERSSPVTATPAMR